ncbi:ABC transporter [Verrucomicrobia bacterium LW23]|nr:ABC transporter [Verrucomicrobia bacterium LW23]
MLSIDVRNLTKIYRTYVKEPGFLGALKGLGSRTYKETAAARDVTFSVEEGELVGFLGPNGAGKTTTLKMLSGLLHPSRGEAKVLGYTPWERHNDFKRQFALVLGQKNQLWWDLPAAESLELNRVIYGLDRKQGEKVRDELTEMLDVRDKLHIMVRELSLGERMKFELIAALQHGPRVLFLDEPTIGLDVVSQKKVREFLAVYSCRRKITTLLTSHYMQDIEQLCERVIIIDEGTVRFDGPLREITEKFSSHKIVTVKRSKGLRQDYDYTPLGEVVERSLEAVKLKVLRPQVVHVCREVLETLDADDLDIEEVPIEDIIREVFSGGKMTPATPPAESAV